MDLLAQPVVSHFDVGLDGIAARAAELSDEQLAATESKTTVSPSRGVCPGDCPSDPGWAPSPEAELSPGLAEEETAPELSEAGLQTAAELSVEQLAATESQTTVSPSRGACPGDRSNGPGWAPSPEAELSPGPGDEDAAPKFSAGEHRTEASTAQLSEGQRSSPLRSEDQSNAALQRPAQLSAALGRPALRRPAQPCAAPVRLSVGQRGAAL